MGEHMSRAFDPVQLGTIELFCKAAELGSFTATAQVLGVTPASVSRSIQRLEARLGVKLFHRTTRSVRLTHDGELYREQCQQALEQIAEAERAITGRQRPPRGMLRISVGTVYAHHRLVPLLPGFMAAYPEVELELNVSNRNIDFVEDGYDLAIRLGEPRDGRIIA
ncbi:LysR family transcriptional regulator, partial [Aeromonas caviae]|uniref:LysR family transcriptional regulator n=1 Tax=Aeromonas caviae TaxID=648 RepID=UPI0025B6C9D2